jgi:hypothetical protein
MIICRKTTSLFMFALPLFQAETTVHYGKRIADNALRAGPGSSAKPLQKGGLPLLPSLW